RLMPGVWIDFGNVCFPTEKLDSSIAVQAKVPAGKLPPLVVSEFFRKNRAGGPEAHFQLEARAHLNAA
ncbi:MAG: hypothetical protein ACPGVU_02815, partial [Limisphaerales bacterium]